jgi:hypothetical protein
MVSNEDAILILGSQKSRVQSDSGSFEAWLNVTMHCIEDIFGKDSSQLNAFNEIKTNFARSSLSPFHRVFIDRNEETYRKQAEDYLTELIMYKKKIKKIENDNKSGFQKIKDEVDKITSPELRMAAAHYEMSDNAFDTKPIEKSSQPIKRNHWWQNGIIIPIIIAAIGGAFTLGYYFGNNKFDEKKIELNDQNRELRSDTALLNNQLLEMRQLNNDLLNKVDSLMHPIHPN